MSSFPALQARGLAGVSVAMVASLAGMLGCTRGDQGTRIRIDGSSTVYPVTEAVVEEFRAERPEVKVTAAFSGTTAGFSQFAAEEIDIWGASRAIREEEKQQLADAGIDFVELTVAYDGLAVIINPENDWAETLTVEQLKQIWRPDDPAEKWSDVNRQWPDEEIHLYGPGTASGTFEYFTEAVVGETGASTSDFTASENDNVLVTGVSQDKYGLAYFGFAYYIENADRLKLAGIDSGDGPVKPSIETVSGGTYEPLSRPLFIYVRQASLENPDTADFVRFYLENAAELATEVGYVPVPAEVQEGNWERLAEALPDDATAASDDAA